MPRMKAAEFLAKPPNLDDLLKQVQAGDPDAVELVKAVFAVQDNNAALAKWASDHQQQLSQFTTAMQGKVIAEVADSRAKGGRAGANARKLSADRQYGVWVKLIGEVMSANPELKFGQRGIRQTLNDALKKQGHYLTPKQLSEAIARSKKA